MCLLLQSFDPGLMNIVLLKTKDQCQRFIYFFGVQLQLLAVYTVSLKMLRIWCLFLLNSVCVVFIMFYDRFNTKHTVFSVSSVCDTRFEKENSSPTIN